MIENIKSVFEALTTLLGAAEPLAFKIASFIVLILMLWDYVAKHFK